MEMLYRLSYPSDDVLNFNELERAMGIEPT